MKTINFILYLVDVLLKRPNIKNGFIYEEPKKEDWKAEEFGATRKVYLKSKDWQPYRSRGELQKRPSSAETMACVSYATNNALEQKMNRMKRMVENDEADEDTQELVKVFKYFDLYDEYGEANLSDPFTAKMSNTSYRGNNFNNVCQSVRHNGIVAESVWLTPDKYTWRQYYKNIPISVKNKGKEFAEYVEITHEWVQPLRFNDIKEYSPVITSVCTDSNWRNNDIEIKPRSRGRHNHAVDNDFYEDKKFDGIYDSYKPFTKKVAWNYGLGTGKIIGFRLKKKLPNLREQLLKEGFSYVLRAEKEKGARGEAYDILSDKLDYVSPQEWNKRAVEEKTAQKKIKFITEDEYNKLNG